MLTSAPIMQPSDWTLPFEIMCDANDYVLGAVLGQNKDKKGHYVVDHLLRLVCDDSFQTIPISDTFPDEQLFNISILPRFPNIVNFLVIGKMPPQ